MEGLKSFSLAAYLANPKLQVVTRSGHKVEILKTDLNKDNDLDSDHLVAVETYPGGYQSVNTYSDDGRFKSSDSDKDLFFAPVLHERWAVMVENDNIVFDNKLYYTKEEAEAHSFPDCRVVKVLWEE